MSKEAPSPRPAPRYLILVAERTGLGALDYHRNHRLYEYAGQAEGYARDEKRSRTKVLIVDPNLLEEHGTDAQAQFAFAERMMLHYGERADRLRSQLAAGEPKGEKPVKPPPRMARKPRQPARPRRRRQNATTARLLQNLAVGAAAVVVGNLLSKAIAKPDPTGAVSDLSDWVADLPQLPPGFVKP